MENIRMYTCGTGISCGIEGYVSFGLPTEKNVAELKKHADRIKKGKSRAMSLVSLNDGQYPLWEAYLKEVGYKKIGRTVRNPNSGRKIRLYVLQREQRAR